MIRWTDMTFTGTDFVKLIGFVCGLLMMYVNIVKEIHANKVDYDADKKVLEYRLTDLEKCCDAAVTPRVALKPDEPRIVVRRR